MTTWSRFAADLDASEEHVAMIQFGMRGMPPGKATTSTKLLDDLYEVVRKGAQQSHGLDIEAGRRCFGYTKLQALQVFLSDLGLTVGVHLHRTQAPNINEVPRRPDDILILGVGAESDFLQELGVS